MIGLGSLCFSCIFTGWTEHIHKTWCTEAVTGLDLWQVEMLENQVDLENVNE